MSDPWFRIAVSCSPDDSDEIAALLVGMTGQGVEQPEAGEVRSMAPTRPEADELLAALRRLYPGVQGEVTEAEPIDWTVQWRDGIITRRFGRLVVTPSWLPVVPAGDEVVVTLDPESAFGNGEHGSTRAAMSLLERQLRPGMMVLDFGSGSGILAIAAVLLGAARAIGIEVDEEAIPIAESNAEKNGVADKVAFLPGDAGELGPLSGPADLICSNILRSVNTLLLPSLRDSLRPGGLAIFSGMETDEADLFRPVLNAHGWTIVDECHDGGWWGVTASVA